MVTGILGFFVLGDALLGLAGRYDLTLSAVFSVWALARLRRRVPAAGAGRAP